MSKSVNSIKMRFLFYGEAKLPNQLEINFYSPNIHMTHTFINTDGDFILSPFYLFSINIKSD